MGGTMPAQDTAPSFAGAPGPATGGAYNTASLYVDSAIPRSEFRVRYDSMWDNNRPDRGEFFYPKCGCLRFPSAGANFDPSARGPILPETNITNTQEVRSYLEYAFSNRLSTFVEVPIRIINPEQNDNTSGLGDIDAGFKYAFVYNENTVLTFQFRTYTPTGDGDKGLGTEHVSLEPALLLYQRLGERANFEAELRDWIATGGSDFAGNVIRYGVSFSYLALDSCRYRVLPVAEVVGWTFLSGKESIPGNVIRDASGDTIVNAKVGMRLGFGNLSQPGFLSGTELGISYGRALTGEFLYKDIVRAELRVLY